MNTSRFLSLALKALSLTVFGCCDNQKTNKNIIDSKDYILVNSVLTPTISDSLEQIITYEIIDDRAFGCNHDQDKEQIKFISSKYKYYNPLQISNLKVQSNYPETVYRRTRFINDTTIGVAYHLKCNRIVISRPGQPPPPPQPGPPNFIKINFDMRVKYKDFIVSKPLNGQQKSSTLTVFISDYKDFPTTKTYQVLGWKYNASIKIYKNNTLAREYNVSDEIPNLQKVTSYILSDKKLVIEVLD